MSGEGESLKNPTIKTRKVSPSHEKRIRKAALKGIKRSDEERKGGIVDLSERRFFRNLGSAVDNKNGE